jgi:hypothetical protein
MRCDHCQSLLLDHLYGLLDGPDGAAVDAHLAGCPDCTAARERAQKARDLFARAAKFSFPDVRFVPPAEDAPAGAAPAAAATPSSAVVPSRPAHPRDWSAWASVAAVLLLVPGTILPVRHVTGNYDDARRAANAASARYGEARAARNGIAMKVQASRQDVETNYRQLEDAHNDLLARWVAAEWNAEQMERNRKLAVEVDRPAAVQPGAPNEVVVVVKDASKLPPGRVEAQVRDQAGQVVASQPIDPNRRDNRHPVTIPAEVWARPEPPSELYLTVAAVDGAAKTRTDLMDHVRLFGPVYATMLATDKATYRPGERLYFRSLTLDRVSFRPPEREQVLRFELRKVDSGNPVVRLEEVGVASPVRVADGKVEPVVGPDGLPVRGVGCGAFVLPDNLPDGDYALVLTEEGPRATIPVPVTRTVRVRRGLPEKFAKEIGWKGASFEPGETVSAWAELKLGDKPVAGAKVLVAGEVDGRPFPIPLPKGEKGWVTKDKGRAEFTFQMPRQQLLIPGSRGDVRLKVTFEPADGSRPESIAKQVPVTGKEVIVEFFPEGGDLIADVPCKVYVRATSANGQPAEIRGTVTDGKDAVAQVETVNDPKEPGANRGLGEFTFTPKANTTYSMKLERPAATDAIRLPAVKAGGVAMHIDNPVTTPGEAIRVQLHSPDKPRTLVVGAYIRGRPADTRSVDVKPGETAEVKLMGGDDPRGGVTRITVFEMPGGTPVAERLVFRKPGEKLNLSYASNLGPDGRVDLTVTATDEKDKAVPAIVWVAAVNSAYAPGPKDRLLPTHFLLAGEVQTPDALEYADFLLTDHPKAPESLDRVLATQGWRRFAEQKPSVDLTQKRTAFLDHERLQVLNGQYRGGADTPHDRDRQRVIAGFWPSYEEVVARLAVAQKAKEAVDADKSWEPAYQQAKQVADGRRPEAAERLGALKAAAGPLTAARKLIWAAVGGLVVLGGAFALVGFRGRRPFALAAVGALALAGGLLVSDSSIAVRAGEVIPIVPSDDAVDPLALGPAPPSVAKIVLPDKPGDPVVIKSGGQDTPGIPVPPTNAASRQPREPGVRVKEGPPALLDRRVVSDDDLGHRLRKDVRIGPPPPVPDEAIRQAAAEKAAAAEYAHGRWQSIGAKIAVSVVGQPGAAITPAEVLSRLLAAVPRTPPLVVREFAAPRPAPTATPDDEPDTVLWEPLLVLPYDGKASLSFHAGAAQGGYQILVAGHTLDGRLGAVRGVILAAPPAPVPPK